MDSRMSRDPMPRLRSTLDWEALSLRLTFTALTVVAIIFLVGPSLIVVLTSLTASQSSKGQPSWRALRWFIALLDAAQMQQAAGASLIVAFGATVLSAVLGMAAA